jgi:hypothetical protein
MSREAKESPDGEESTRDISTMNREGQENIA